MIKTDEDSSISVKSQLICTEPSEQGLFFEASQNESKECYAMIKTDKNLNISMKSWLIYTEPSEQGLFFQASRNESKGVVCYHQNWWKLKYLSGISIDMHQQFVWIFHFFELFHTEVAQMTRNGKFCQEKWLRLAQNSQFGHFAYFSSFPTKWGWDWLGMANFTWFRTFLIFATKVSHFLEKSQKFSFSGGKGYIGKFFEFLTFSNHFILSGSKWPTMVILPLKWLRLAQNGQFG